MILLLGTSLRVLKPQVHLVASDKHSKRQILTMNIFHHSNVDLR